MAGARKHIRIIAVVDEYDLRKVISQKKYLQNISMKFGLEHLEAVLFTNRSLTRFRLILRILDSVFVCAPWIDKEEQHSLYLKISEELGYLAQVDCKVKLDGIMEEKKNRLETRHDPAKSTMDHNGKKQ